MSENKMLSEYLALFDACLVNAKNECGYPCNNNRNLAEEFQ